MSCLNCKFCKKALEAKFDFQKINNAQLHFDTSSVLFFSENLTPYNQYLAWKSRDLKRANLIHSTWSSKGLIKIRRSMNEKQYQLNMRMTYSISTQTLYLKKTIDQVKGSRFALITWDHGKVFTWEWCVTIFVHFQFFGIYSFMRFLVCNQINNGYCYYLFNSTFLLKQKFMDYIHWTNVSDETTNFLTCS